MKDGKRLGKAGSTAVAVIGLVLGVMLMLFGSFGGISNDGGGEREESLSAEVYRAQVEKRIGDLCSAVRGVGQLRVFVSVSGGYEYVYSVNQRGECVTVGSGSSERAVVEEVRSPEIVGVGIVCAGGGDPAVKNALIQLVSSSLGIGANRVVVMEGNES